MYEPLDPAHWIEFFFTVAAAGAALIGLIVVGLSIHADYIARSITHRSHARATLVVLTATMVIGLAALVPQPHEWAGWESGDQPRLRLDQHVQQHEGPAAGRLAASRGRLATDGDRLRHRRLRPHRRRSRSSLGGGQGGGLYWIGLETIGGLVWAIAGAWRFLIGVTDEKRS